MRYIVTGIVIAMAAGCAGNPEDSADAEKTKVGYTTYELTNEPGAPQGAIDAVSGDWVPKDSAYKTLYEGLTYYFSSKENMEAFERRPHDFVTADGYLRKPLDDVRREAEVR